MQRDSTQGRLCEDGGTRPWAKDAWSSQEPQRAGRTLPWSFWGERGPAHTWI